MEKLVTEKQLAANRRNAQKSTGPVTADGKAASRWNAVKHGLLSQQTLARGNYHQESTAQFKTLHQAYHRHLAPVGPLEEMLVHQIVTTAWRLRRVRIAEAGDVACSVDRKWWNPRRAPWEHGNYVKGNALTSSALDRYCTTIRGIEFIIECIERLRTHVQKAGRFDWRQIEGLPPHHPSWNEILEKLNAFDDWLTHNPERLPPEELRARHVAKVLAYLDEEIVAYRQLMPEVQKDIDGEDAMRRAAAMLPTDEVLDKIVRYESVLLRQLFRSMNHLERLQRRRLGEHVPPPAALDLTTRT